VGVLLKIVQCFTAACLLFALRHNPYDYYVFLRFIVCGVSAYSAFFSNRLKKPIWTWIFGILALLFNPVSKIHLHRQSWSIINLLAAALMVAAVFCLVKRSEKSAVPKTENDT
jgi:uncharacterized membrane protein HdeD (DUF308 family)